MADKRTDLEVNVTARADQAKRELGVVSADVKELEGDHEIGVTVDDDATDPIADIRTKLDNLTDADREIALKGTADQLEREIRRAERSLSNLDKYDQEEIEIRLDARDNASRKLEAVRDEMRLLDGDTADVRIDATETGLDDIKSKLGDIGGGFAVGGGLAGAGRAGLIGGVIAGAGAMAVAFANAALEAQTIADAFGAPVEQASRLMEVAGQSGIEFNDIFDLLAQFNSAIADTPELADKLKIDPDDDTIEQFLTAVENLQTEVDDVGERGIIAAKLFGEEGNRQVTALQTEVGDLRTAMEDLADVRVISDADVDAAREIKTQLREAESLWRALQRGLGVASGQILLPAVNDILGGGNRTGQPFPTHQPGSDLLGRLSFGLLGDAGGDQVAGPGGWGTSQPYRQQITVINPPGTPALTRQQYEQWIARNGDRS